MSKRCNDSWADEPQYFQQVLYIPVFLLGLLLNVLAVTVLLLKRRQWTDTHIYTLNLALTDLALVLFLPVRVFAAYHPLEPSDFCSAMVSIHYINMYASIFTVTCISVHRYLSIRFPFWAREQSTKKRIAVLVCTLIWVTVVSLCLVFGSNNTPEKLCTCYSRRDEERLSLTFLLVLVILGYVLPLVTLTFCSIQTSCILRTSGEHQSGEETSVLKKTFVRLVTANWIVFVVCYTPIHVAMCLVEYHKVDVDRTSWSSLEGLIHNFREVAEWIATTNCCFDSFGYYFLLRQYLKDESQSDSASPTRGRATSTDLMNFTY
ncbi:G-protein coupled receptor 35-like [Alosa sapidissima]|uniref:G-protein coupled receptor 35-like n=1 Tax=Alosa sapidissima TaxID=34773 RepID=UPI001C08BBCC|nr:G-protein coupled receptor 35-like [Alosa sapidissima]